MTMHSDNRAATGVLALLAAFAASGAMACANRTVDIFGPSSGDGQGFDAGAPGQTPIGPPIAGVDAGLGMRKTCGADGGAMPSGPPIPPGARGGFTPQLPATVKHAAAPVPPLTGGTLLAPSGGQTAVAADPDRDQVYVVDLASNTVRATVALQPGDEPGRLVKDATGRVDGAPRRGGAVVSL